MSGEFRLGLNAEIIAGTVLVDAFNATLFNGSLINVTALAGPPRSRLVGSPLERLGRAGDMEGEVLVVSWTIRSCPRMCGVGMLIHGLHWQSHGVTVVKAVQRTKKRIMAGKGVGELGLQLRIVSNFMGVF